MSKKIIDFEGKGLENIGGRLYFDGFLVGGLGYSDTFDDADLVAGVLTVPHNIGQYPLPVAISDNNGDLVAAPVNFIDANTLAVDLSLVTPIVGDWVISIGGVDPNFIDTGQLPTWWNDVSMYVSADSAVQDDSLQLTPMSAITGVTIDNIRKKWGAGSMLGAVTPEVQITMGAGNQTSGALTIAFWIYADGTQSATHSAVVYLGNRGSNTSIAIGINSASMYAEYASGNIGPSAIPLDQWVHVAFTRDVSGTMRMYFDGVYKGKRSTSLGTFPPIGTSYMFRNAPGGGYVDAHLSGNIDDFLFLKDQALWTTETFFSVPTGAHNKRTSYPGGEGG